jgi:hypothetical protein
MPQTIIHVSMDLKLVIVCPVPDTNALVTRWTPVKNLTFSAEVMGFFLDQKFTGSAILTPVAPKPTTVYEFKDQSAVSLNVRVQRNF